MPEQLSGICFKCMTQGAKARPMASVKHSPWSGILSHSFHVVADSKLYWLLKPMVCEIMNPAHVEALDTKLLGLWSCHGCDTWRRRAQAMCGGVPIRNESTDWGVPLKASSQIAGCDLIFNDPGVRPQTRRLNFPPPWVVNEWLMHG